MKKKKFRPIRTPVHFARIFQKEGLEKTIKGRIKPKLNISELHDASIFLFKQILNPNDIRWKLATRFAEIKKEVPFSPINLENGLRSKYASRSQGKNKARGTSITGQLHILQLVRALRNIDLGHAHFAWRTPISLGSGKYELKFVETKSITKQRDKHGVSGCPEALWQLQLWSKKGYLGRIGLNFHSEESKNIVTIANIQGALGKKREQLDFEKEMGNDFGKELIKRLQQILGNNFEYRGIVPTQKNQTLYRMSFRKAKPEKIKVWSGKIKTQIEDRRKNKNTKSDARLQQNRSQTATSHR
jgi:hypothetical protein